jgi:alginate O-acetyltransferase complex protein AlgI
MSYFVPQDARIIWLTLASYGVILMVSFALTRIRPLGLARVAAWLFFVLAVGTLILICHSAPPLYQVAAIIGVLFPAMKAIVTIETLAMGETPLRPWQWFAFAAGWLGTRPTLFASVGAPVRSGAGELIWFGASRTLLGVGLVALARWLWLVLTPELGEFGAACVVSVFLAPGVSFMIHFGVPHVVAGVWRLAGVDCRALFRSPFKSHSLSEFWGRRWNLAFTEMTTLTVYRPLSKVVGGRVAMAGVFVWSGLLHELALSVPVNAGYGLPTLYFLLHGSLVYVERGLERLGWPIDRLGWVGRVWTVLWVVVPLPLLFHLPFVRGAVWPILLGLDPNGAMPLGELARN